MDPTANPILHGAGAAAPPARSATRRPGRGVGGWLGRQLGYIVHAVHTPVSEKQIYRRQIVQQQLVASNAMARRIVTDELIIEKNTTPGPGVS